MKKILLIVVIVATSISGLIFAYMKMSKERELEAAIEKPILAPSRVERTADGSTVTLNQSCQANDEVVFEILDTFSVLSIDDRVGIESGGSLIGRSSTLNFTGAGNTVSLKGDGSIDIAISGGARGGGSDKVFQENQRTVTTSYTLTSGYSAVSVGPVTVSAGATVTIPGTQRWVVL